MKIHRITEKNPPKFPCLLWVPEYQVWEYVEHRPLFGFNATHWLKIGHGPGKPNIPQTFSGSAMTIERYTSLLAEICAELNVNRPMDILPALRNRIPPAVALGKLGGSRNTPAQNEARRLNGKLGGRPRTRKELVRKT